MKAPDLDGSDYLDFISGMGYIIYEDPTDNELILICDRPMTLGQYRKKSAWIKGSEKWWDNETDYPGQASEELLEFSW